MFGLSKRERAEKERREAEYKALAEEMERLTDVVCDALPRLKAPLETLGLERTIEKIDSGSD